MSALVGLAYVSLLVLALLDNLRGPFLPEILNDLGLTAIESSFFFASTSIMAFISCWRGHVLLTRVNSVVLLAGASALLAGGFAGIGGGTLPFVYLACAVFGVGYGGLNLAQAVLISEAAEGERRRRLFSGLHAMYGLASFVAPLVATLSRSLGLSWRQAFLASAVLPLGLALVAFRHARKGERHASSTAAPREMLRREEWSDCVLFAVFLSAYLWAEISLSTRMVQWLRQERNFSADSADLYLSAFFAMLLAGRIVVGLGVGRRLSNWRLLAMSAMGGAVLALLGLNVYEPLLILSGLAMAPFYPVMMDQISHHFSRRSSQALGFIIGSGSGAVVVMHLVIGTLTQHWGLAMALQVCAGALGVISIALFRRAR